MTAPLNTASLVSRLRDIAMGRLKPDNGSSVPLADELRAAADALEATSRALSEKEGLIDRLRMEAQIHAGEARCHKSTVHEAYQACTGATGEPGNWHGAEPIRKALSEATRQRDEALAALKASEERGERLSQDLASARLRPELWQDIATAPKDGRPFEAQYDDGSTERDVYWASERYCILGAPQGSKGPGCMSSGIGLPVDPTYWRPQGRLPELADATNNPPSDPGTEQREAGRG